MLDMSVYGAIAAICVGLFGLGATLLVQCGEKRSAPKKKGKSMSTSANKSVRSQRSAMAGPGQLKTSTRSAKSAPLNKSKRSSRSLKAGKSARSKKSEKEKSAAARLNKSRSSRKSSRGADLGLGKQLIPGEQIGRASARKTRSLRDKQQPSLKSTQRIQPLAYSQRSKKELELAETQKDLLVAAGTASGQNLQMEPRELRFSEQGGLLKVQLHNPTNTRQAIKVKCSDNNLYRVNPVYGYVEPGQQLNVEVVRQGGAPKVDKLVFVTTKAPADNVDMKGLFKKVSKREAPMMVLPLVA